MKLVADSMLGRLARWLRLLGYDTLYFPHIEDSVLLRIAREQDRMLLTRDTRLVKVRGLTRFLLLAENDPLKQLKEVFLALKLKIDDTQAGSGGFFPGGRCADCNGIISHISKEEVRESVPEYVFQNSDVFSKCTMCGKIYWSGTHPEKFRRKLEETLQG